jgi:hypothetical protein
VKALGASEVYGLGSVFTFTVALAIEAVIEEVMEVEEEGVFMPMTED